MSANRTQQKVDEGKMPEGLQQHASSTATLTVQNKSVTVTQAIATLQGRIDAITAAQQAKTMWIDAVQKQNEELAAMNAFVGSLATVVRGMYAGSPTTLADFGITPRKVTTLTAEQKLLASQKRAATRIARHTMSAKQKAGAQLYEHVDGLGMIELSAVA